MATADSVKAKIQGLIDTANATTGNTDTDLTTAVGSLVAGYGQGGGDSYDLLRKRLSDTLESLDIDMQGLSLTERAFNSCTNIKTVRMKNVGPIRGRQYIFYKCTALERLELSLVAGSYEGRISAYLVYDDPNLKTVILENFSAFEGNVFTSAIALTNLVLKSDAVVSQTNPSAFNNTPFASGGTGGTIYIPQTLYDQLGTGSALDYKSATNWATLDAYGTITWMPIEGSEFE